jgi:hypothetical protein
VPTPGTDGRHGVQRDPHGLRHLWQRGHRLHRQPGRHLHGPVEQPERDRPDLPGHGELRPGVGTASIKLVDAQSTTLTATQGTITGTSGSFTVALATTTTFTVTSSPDQTAGTAFSITLTAADAYGNATPSYTGLHVITWSGATTSPKGNAPVYRPTSCRSPMASAPLHCRRRCTLRAPTPSSHRASLPTVAGSTTITVSPLTASTFTVPTPGTQTAGTAFNETITAKDTYGNVATGYTGSQSVVFTGPASSPGLNNPIYPATVNFASGVGTASITLVDAQSTTLTATQGSITGISGSFTVSPAAASTFVLSNPGNQTAGTAFSDTITAHDAYGNVATGFTGSQAITFTGPLSSPSGTAPFYPATVNFAAGVGTASGITAGTTYRPRH